jgi:hypothetical protein
VWQAAIECADQSNAVSLPKIIGLAGDLRPQCCISSDSVYLSTMASSPSLPIGFPGNIEIAEELGFLYLAVGGSRVYQQQNQTSVPKTAAKIQDWDLFGLVESKEDILCLVLQKETQLRLLLGIIDAKDHIWKV